MIYYSSIPFDQVDWDVMNQLKSNGHSILGDLTSAELIELLRQQCLPDSVFDIESKVSAIIINIREVSFLEKVINILRTSTNQSNNRPRIVVISNFMTWTGCENYGILESSNESFQSRISSRGYSEQYDLENMLYSMRNRHHDVCVICKGLIYGNCGYDFYDMFRFLWEENLPGNKLFHFSLMASASKVPLIHVVDYIDMICYISTEENLPPFFNPASDGYEWIAEDFLASRPQEWERIKCLSMCNTDAVSTDPLELLEYVPQLKSILSFPACSLFSLRYPCGLKEQFSKLWVEFTSSNRLSPFKVLITGPPRAGKTQCSSTLANMLGLPVVDILSSVNYIIKEEYDPSLNSDGILALRNSIS